MFCIKNHCDPFCWMEAPRSCMQLGHASARFKQAVKEAIHHLFTACRVLSKKSSAKVKKRKKKKIYRQVKSLNLTRTSSHLRKINPSVHNLTNAACGQIINKQNHHVWDPSQLLMQSNPLSVALQSGTTLPRSSTVMCPSEAAHKHLQVNYFYDSKAD